MFILFWKQDDQFGIVKTILIFIAGRCKTHENDISAEEASAFKGTWLQKENGYKIRQKGIGSQKKKGQKVLNCVSNFMSSEAKSAGVPAFLPF